MVYALPKHPRISFPSRSPHKSSQFHDYMWSTHYHEVLHMLFSNSCQMLCTTNRHLVDCRCYNNLHFHRENPHNIPLRSCCVGFYCIKIIYRRFPSPPGASPQLLSEYDHRSADRYAISYNLIAANCKYLF